MSNTVLNALLIYIDDSAKQHNRAEFSELVRAAGLKEVACISVRNNHANSRFLIGKGKVAEIYDYLTINKIDIVIFNHILSPVQERNLEQNWQIQVIDRIGLILNIFAQRARSYEGKLQVELAQLKRLATRLIRGWTHLERQKGGIGLRGPGEKQLETDRRLIKQRIKLIHRSLDKVKLRRRNNRQKRKKDRLPVIALLGYTNVGKSSLFNELTKAQVQTGNQLFMTLDPTIRGFEYRPKQIALLTDTVGFIGDLPEDLVSSFQATMEEIHEADLLIHVIDVEPEGREQRIETINQLIDNIGAQYISKIEVYNKIDQHANIHIHTEAVSDDHPVRVWMSLKQKQGIYQLKSVISDILMQNHSHRRLRLPFSAAQMRAKLFSMDAVRNERYELSEGGWLMDVVIEDYRLKQLCQEAQLTMNVLQC